MTESASVLIDITDSPAALNAQVGMVLERARWASQVYQRYDRDATLAITEAVARVAHSKAAEYAEWAVRETGFGVVEHKKLKNELSSLGLLDYYRNWDFVNPRIDEERKIIEIPRPAGVVFALAPSTNPVATVYFKVISALLTRNAIVFSPHPAALECCTDALDTLTAAAIEAGAPDGIIQVVRKPTVPLIEAYMGSDKTDVTLATGGSAMVRAAYSSSNPAIGVGPGNAPAFVDATADIKQAAQNLIESKSFDNSILCTNESVVITLQSVDDGLRRALKSAGAHMCSEEETDALRQYLFHERGFNVEAIGRDASWIASQAGFKISTRATVLVAPITKIGVDEALSREKLCPVLGYYVASSNDQAIAQARGLLRMSGAGHSASIHSQDAQAAIDFASAVETYRVVVNAPCSQGAAGFATNLPPSFTIGTGFYGRSSIGENIGPQHLLHWTKLAYNNDPAETMGDYTTTQVHHKGPLVKAPADGISGYGGGRSPQVAPQSSPVSQGAGSSQNISRDEIRQIIVEELRAALKA
ncbi:MAG: aldehyde dehydrogenase family protein [Rhodospirillales bacterium]|jgi:acyl-CoA reductase-like NAD-dependent aldehyde dehydrogenase|nr:aldehyde dehydrogenase family protein [Rhodospirillales bacterium]MBT4038558.1 aldehyde dehydrogenase family protein [Rhodospirillales bacterium]MBT4627415.1 aldehyde dehydrogenase family protein [Rhodospirillales bacterium]MBT5351468.1 aldehyde dehydrogenase family protein [Rhodospirillales bacterium]MBT5519131.1 aldehyde dehydrogenase family protein [Rhodospirillales bacterium]